MPEGTSRTGRTTTEPAAPVRLQLSIFRPEGHRDKGRETMYNYRENVKSDVCDYIRENCIHWTAEDRDDVESQLRDDLFCEDSVTGNGSGSYTMNAEAARDNLAGHYDLLAEALEEFCCGPDWMIKHGVEEQDVTIRCYLLGECVRLAIEELEGEGWN